MRARRPRPGVDARMHPRTLRQEAHTSPRAGDTLFSSGIAGSHEEIDELIEEMSARSSSELDYPVYARLYWAYASLEEDEVNIFDDARGGWTAMRAGLKHLIKQQPKSDYLLNGLARFACLAGDVEEYTLSGHSWRSALPRRPGRKKTDVKRCDQRMAAARGKK
jgi:hypothetical protein